jgi:hypothetical protein
MKLGSSFSNLLLTFMERVSVIARALSAFWLPDVTAAVHPDYRNVFNLAEHDKLMVLGIPTSSLDQEVSRDVCYRVHCELFSMFELVYSWPMISLPCYFLFLHVVFSLQLLMYWSCWRIIMSTISVVSQCCSASSGYSCL